MINNEHFRTKKPDQKVLKVQAELQEVTSLHEVSRQILNLYQYMSILCTTT